VAVAAQVNIATTVEQVADSVNPVLLLMLVINLKYRVQKTAPVAAQVDLVLLIQVAQQALALQVSETLHGLQLEHVLDHSFNG
jgi:hypothetical protein